MGKNINVADQKLSVQDRSNRSTPEPKKPNPDT